MGELRPLIAAMAWRRQQAPVCARRMCAGQNAAASIVFDLNKDHPDEDDNDLLNQASGLRREIEAAMS